MPTLLERMAAGKAGRDAASAERAQNRREAKTDETCQSCNSKQILSFGGDFRDLGYMKYTNGEETVSVENDYLPGITNINDGGDVDVKVCMNCGQVQGKFPVSDTEVLSQFGNRDDDIGMSWELDLPDVIDPY